MHLTYCTNIHPGESWAEIFASLRRHIPEVKRSVSPNAPFPIGLRLSGRAALELDEAESDRLLQWCADNGCFIPTVNGFPYGAFHGRPVKQGVYRPDWRSIARVEYTNCLADWLDRWLPRGTEGSISTVPLGFKTEMDEGAFALAQLNLREVLEHLRELRERSGKKIVLALEPEPGCVLETTREVVTFFRQLELPPDLVAGLGVCFDCCHQAVQFEDPLESLRLLADNDVSVAKVQVSSALCVDGGAARLTEVCEPTYLHQVVVKRRDGSLSRYVDLPEALAAGERGEWRVHFHVPIFAERMGEFGTTRFFLEEILPALSDDLLLEVETYTWGVLPPKWRTDTVAESIARELQWVEAYRVDSNRRS